VEVKWDYRKRIVMVMWKPHRIFQSDLDRLVDIALNDELTDEQREQLEAGGLRKTF
jgi:hypothetical protein